MKEERKGQKKKREWVVWSPSRLGRSFVEVDGGMAGSKSIVQARPPPFSLAPSSVRFFDID